MEFKVQLLSYFDKYLPKDNVGDTFSIRSDKPMTPADIFKQLNVTDDITNICLVCVNGTVVSHSHMLADGDFIAVIPMHYGG